MLKTLIFGQIIPFFSNLATLFGHLVILKGVMTTNLRTAAVSVDFFDQKIKNFLTWMFKHLQRDVLREGAGFHVPKYCRRPEISLIIFLCAY
jgi:hypothetical protein